MLMLLLAHNFSFVVQSNYLVFELVYSATTINMSPFNSRCFLQVFVIFSLNMNISITVAVSMISLIEYSQLYAMCHVVLKSNSSLQHCVVFIVI